MLLDKLKDASGKDGIDYDYILGLIGELNENGLQTYADNSSGQLMTKVSLRMNMTLRHTPSNLL